jgi:hypothetical protein
MFLRINEARELGREYTRRAGFTKAADSILVEKSEFSVLKKYDVFLSHSYNDAEVILGVAKFIENQGKTVYVDWIEDRGLDRKNITAKTADLLRLRMRASKTLIYASTESAMRSKWMPWELGYFDGYKPDMVSILPLVENSDSEWKGQEYLGLYPLVDRLEYSGARTPFVVKKDKSAQRISDFGSSASYFWKDSYGRASL